MPNTGEKLIESLEQSLIDRTGREMRFVGGDSPVIANGVTVQEWISVKDRMPERFGSFVVAVKELGGRIYSDFADFDPYEKWWRTSLARGIEDIVTHWMPLPQPPKGE